jgi:hypothetical protein
MVQRPTDIAAICLENGRVALMKGCGRGSPERLEIVRGHEEVGKIMIDAEVLRLRKLRLMALRARAFAAVMSSAECRDDAVFSRSALTCWQVARVVTGHLRAHPYLSYQQGASPVRALFDQIDALLIGWTALHWRRRASVYTRQLELLARELDDARALTWSAQLSDELGRLQTAIRRSLQELEAGALSESGATPRSKAIGPLTSSAAVLRDADMANNWPYLAI